MAVDPSRFHLLNVTDTCSLWNVLSSVRLYAVASQVGCSFCCTSFVYYECLVKRRKREDQRDKDLQVRLKQEIHQGRIKTCNIDIGDLQEVMALENRKRVSKGELSSIAFAKKTNQAFLTDDKGARKLGEQALNAGKVQTTPHLFGWLYFTNQLADSEKQIIIKQHEEMGRPLGPHFEKMYETALNYRLMATTATNVANA